MRVLSFVKCVISHCFRSSRTEVFCKKGAASAVFFHSNIYLVIKIELLKDKLHKENVVCARRKCLSVIQKSFFVQFGFQIFHSLINVGKLIKGNICQFFFAFLVQSQNVHWKNKVKLHSFQRQLDKKYYQGCKLHHHLCYHLTLFLLRFYHPF